MDTIFALSSGAPPAAIAVVRISGPLAGDTLMAFAGRRPRPRRAQLMALTDDQGDLLDRALVLWLPGPATATGEDLAELHLHGGRSVVAAVELALSAIPGLRRAGAGEFTRRAFNNGRIDMAEAEGLADLLEAETEIQRRSALASATGALSRQVEAWREELLDLSAEIEAILDFGDEDDVVPLSARFGEGIARLRSALRAALAAPRAEQLRQGFRVALAGPPNCGKSTLYNALVGEDAAITSPIAGTTRDVLERPISMEGVPFTIVDMAGLRADSGDTIEDKGIERAETEIQRADLVLWLGPENAGAPGCWEIEAKCDEPGHGRKSSPRHRLSAVTGEGMNALRADLLIHARASLTGGFAIALNNRQRSLIAAAESAVGQVGIASDPLIVAEHLRVARREFDSLLGRSATNDVLDAIFGRFCIGK